jgi:hypothetical protein
MINPLSRAPALLARLAHDVITEYRKIDAAAQPAQQAHAELSCTQAATQVSTAGPPRIRGAVERPFATGFGPPARKDSA